LGVLRCNPSGIAFRRNLPACLVSGDPPKPRASRRRCFFVLLRSPSVSHSPCAQMFRGPTSVCGPCWIPLALLGDESTQQRNQALPAGDPLAMSLQATALQTCIALPQASELLANGS